tara:strand:+ start:535 stop:2172 length:1638 start_codon:yes stop_codon:yes gene_type:complete
MKNIVAVPKGLNLLLAIIVAVLTTGFLRLQLASGLPQVDEGLYIFASQYLYHSLGDSEALNGATLVLYLYQFINSWVYGFDINQTIMLRAIDGLVAITSSIVLFKIILKESDSRLFTVILMVPLLIIMNDIEVIEFGFRNSIWAAYLSLFTALLIWQNSTKDDKYSFYLIGGLISLGILLREPFLPFFLLTVIAIYTSYGWRVLFKYLIGSAVVGFGVIGFILMLRGSNLIELVDSYTRYGDAIGRQQWKFPFLIIQLNWFIFVTSSISMIYIVKLYLSDKKLVNMKRFCFWLAITLLPLVEYYSKLGLMYHFSNSLIGLAGLSAMGWKLVSIYESKKIQASTILFISLLSLVVILMTLKEQVDKDEKINSLSDLSGWIKDTGAFRSPNTLKRSQMSSVAAQIYNYSRDDSSLAVDGYWSHVYPLTGLLPPKNNSASDYRPFILSDLRTISDTSNFTGGKKEEAIDYLFDILIDYRPTLIVASTKGGELFSLLPYAIEKTNLYEIVSVVPPRFSYSDFYLDRTLELGIDPVGWMSATIYRLKDFK